MLIQDQEASSLLETKFELMMNMNNQKMKKEIDSLKQQIDLLSHELETVKKAQARQPSKNEEYQATLGMQFAQPHQFQQQPQQFQQPQFQQMQPQAQQTQQFQQQFQQPAQQAQGTQPRSRTGNTNPEDVSIEKMFYFGGKR